MSTPTLTELCRKLGTARLEELNSNATKPTPVNYPFKWGDCWSGNVGVAVDDLESEIGFWVDLMGFRPFAFFDGTLMFRSPDNTFGMSLSRATEDSPPSGSIIVELMLDNVEEATRTLQSRGAEFDQILHPVWGEEQTMRTSELTSPAGFRVILWGMIGENSTSQSENDVTQHAEEVIDPA